MPPIRAASVRYPLQDRASDNSLRLWLAFFVLPQAAEGSPAEKSVRTLTGAGMARILPRTWNQLSVVTKARESKTAGHWYNSTAGCFSGVKKLAREGKCWDAAEKEFALKKYADMARIPEWSATSRAAIVDLGTGNLILALSGRTAVTL